MLDQSDTAFNNAGGCRLTRLYPGLSATTSGTASHSLAANQIPLCGEMDTWVVGVNWWMTEYMRLMFQYSDSDLSNYPIFVAQNAGLPPGTNNGVRWRTTSKASECACMSTGKADQ